MRGSKREQERTRENKREQERTRGNKREQEGSGERREVGGGQVTYLTANNYNQHHHYYRQWP